MIVKKTRIRKETAKTKRKPKSDWREAIRLHLGKAPWVDAVFAAKENDTVHVYSVVKELRDKYYEGLLEQDNERGRILAVAPPDADRWS